MKTVGRKNERTRFLDIDEICAITYINSIAELARIYDRKFGVGEKSARLVIDRARKKGCTLQNARDIAGSLSEFCRRHIGIDEVVPVRSYDMEPKLLEESFVSAKEDLDRVSYRWDSPISELEAAARVSLPALVTIIQAGLKQPGLVDKDVLIRYGLWLQEISWTTNWSKSIFANKLSGDFIEAILEKMTSSRLSTVAEHLFYHNDFRDGSQYSIFGISVAPISSALAKLSCIKANKSLNALDDYSNIENCLGFGEKPEEMRVYQLAQNHVAYLHCDRKTTRLSKQWLSELKSHSFDTANARHYLRADLQQLQFSGSLSAMIERLELARDRFQEDEVFTQESLRTINLNLWALNGRRSGNETLVDETLSLPNLRWLLLRDKTILLPVTWRFIATELALRNRSQGWLQELFPPSISAAKDKISQDFPLVVAGKGFD